MKDISLRWGLPDWREPEPYPCADDKTSIRRWGWEFLRRRTDYRETWARVESHARSVSDSLRTAVTEDYQATRDAYGMSVLIDPSAEVSDWDLFQFLAFKTWGYGVGYRTEVVSNREENAGLKAIMFDLNRPLGRQIQEANDYLSLLQIELIGSPPPSLKPRVKNWRDFLRVLDARECGATFNEIAKALWSGQHKTPQSARDTYNAAREVQSRAPHFL